VRVVAVPEVGANNRMVAQLVLVASVTSALPLLPVWVGSKAFKAALAVVCPVPPCAAVTAALSVNMVADALGRVNVFAEVVGPVN